MNIHADMLFSNQPHQSHRDEPPQHNCVSPPLSQLHHHLLQLPAPIYIYIYIKTRQNNRPFSFTTIQMKALKCKPSAQFAYNYTINVSSKCGNIISHRSSVFEGRHNAIDLRRSAHQSSIFEGQHIDLRRSTHRSSIFEGRHIDLRRLKAETSRRHSDNSSPNIVHHGAP